jgi:hypothetical protein
MFLHLDRFFDTSYTHLVTQDQIATYRAALKEARDAFDRATARLDELGDEAYVLRNDIDRLRRTITALAAMCSEEPFIDNLGITDSCMEVMTATTDTITSNDVVKALEDRGFDLAAQKNAAASVHAILSRLAKRGKIEKIPQAGGTVVWKGPNYTSAITDEDIPF